MILNKINQVIQPIALLAHEETLLSVPFVVTVP